MEFIALSFAEIIALQNIIDKDEDIVEEVKVSKKTRRNHSYNKGDRAQMKKEKAVRLQREGVIAPTAKGRALYTTANYITHDVYDYLSREEKRRTDAKRQERFFENYEEEKNFSFIKNAYYEAGEALEKARIAVEEAEEKHEELNAEVDWLQYAPATGWTIEQAHNIYMETLKEREDFIPVLRQVRLEYSKALYAYNEAKAAYDMLPFWA